MEVVGQQKACSDWIVPLTGPFRPVARAHRRGPNRARLNHLITIRPTMDDLCLTLLAELPSERKQPLVDVLSSGYGVGEHMAQLCMENDARRPSGPELAGGGGAPPPR
jgi:hypothetical protein